MFSIKSVANNTSKDPDYIAHGIVRYAVYVTDRGWVKPEDTQDGREVDDLDAQSVCAVGYDMLAGGEPAGAIRMIYPNGHPLPIEHVFGVSVDHSERVAEVSRLAILPDYRRTPLLLGLFRWVTQHALEEHLDWLYAIVEQGLYDSLLKFGFPFEQLGHLKEYYGGLTMPVRCPVSGLISGVVEKDAELHRRPLAPFFQKPFDGYVDQETIYK